MVRRKCPSTIETKSSRIHRVIQVTRSGEWSNGEKYRLKIKTISDSRVHQFHYWSDFCDRLDEYGTGASNDLPADSVDPVDDNGLFQKALDKIHKDLMFKNDLEELCVEVHIDKTGKESHNIIECWKYTYLHCQITYYQWLMRMHPIFDYKWIIFPQKLHQNFFFAFMKRVKMFQNVSHLFVNLFRISIIIIKKHSY